MADRERSDAGTFVETVTLEDVRGVFDDVQGPVITSSDVSDALGCTTEAARQKLRRLVDRGELDRRKTGRTVVYWNATDEGRRGPATEAGRSDPGEESGDTVDGTDGDTGAVSDSILIDAVERVAKGWGDTGDRLEARKAAARAVLEYAREHGTVSAQEAKEEVYPEYPVEDQNKDTWYRRNVRPVLGEVGEYDNGSKGYRLTLGDRDV